MTPKKQIQFRESVPLPDECLRCKKNPREQLVCFEVTKLDSNQLNEPTLRCADAGKKVGSIHDKAISRTSEFNKRGFRDDWPPEINSLRGIKERRLL